MRNEYSYASCQWCTLQVALRAYSYPDMCPPFRGVPNHYGGILAGRISFRRGAPQQLLAAGTRPRPTLVGCSPLAGSAMAGLRTAPGGVLAAHRWSINKRLRILLQGKGGQFICYQLLLSHAPPPRFNFITANTLQHLLARCLDWICWPAESPASDWRLAGTCCTRPQNFPCCSGESIYEY